MGNTLTLGNNISTSENNESILDAQHSRIKQK